MIMVTQGSRDYYNAYKDSYTHIISIAAPDDEELKPTHEHHVVYKFWDVDHKLENKFRCYEPPTLNEVIEPVLLAEKWWIESLVESNKVFNLLIHCDAGVSRSPAVTLGVLWRLSSHIFTHDPAKAMLHEYMDARKAWCRDSLDNEFSVPMRRFIDGRYNPGVIPNQAILRHYRESAVVLPLFPW